jgi:hypothetical protein
MEPKQAHMCELDPIVHSGHQCPQPLKADVRALKRNAGFDSKPTKTGSKSRSAAISSVAGFREARLFLSGVTHATNSLTRVQDTKALAAMSC